MSALAPGLVAAPVRVVTGDLITRDPNRPRAEAMAIAGDRIVAVGGRDEVAAVAGPGAPTSAVPGRAVLPGLIDSHVHMLYAGLELRRIDLAGVGSVAEILAAVERAAADGGADDWIFVVGNFEVEDLAERRYPTLAELDAVAGGRPLFVDQRTHDALVNSAALRRAGIDRDTPDPVGGRIERDAGGRPTGRLVERPAFDLVYRCIPPVTHADRLRALREIQPRMHALGLTGVLDPGLDAAELGAYQEAWACGDLTMRTTAMPLVDPALATEDLLERVRGTGVRTGFGDERLRLGGLKVYYDGTGSFGTALMREPWPGQAAGEGPPYGTRVIPHAKLAEIARFCATERWSLGVHAVGGAAIDEVLGAFAEADRHAPIAPLRFTIIHGYLGPSPANFELAARLGIVVALQPSLHWTVGRRLVELLGEQTVARATPVRSWLESGAMVAGGSDGPDFPMPPLFGIWQAATRAVRDRPGALGLDEGISVDAALDLWTTGSAYACFAERERGRLAPGRLADWVALDVDPLAVAPEDLREATVLQTVVGGDVVHEA